jgi:hypothetical protein
MAGIYGPVTEHPEYPIEDARRFSVVILAHEFEPWGSSVSRDLGRVGCKWCGFVEDEPFHTKKEK